MMRAAFALLKDDPASLSLVSSQYGPGVVACWCLSLLSVLISWTIHRKYRNSDSLDLDLLAAVSYPSVAAADAMSKLIHYPHDFSSFDDADLAEVQYIRALQAPLSVCNLFLDFGPLFFLAAQILFQDQMLQHKQRPATLPRSLPLRRVSVIGVVWCVCAVARISRFVWFVRFGLQDSFESLDSVTLAGFTKISPGLIGVWMLFVHVVILLNQTIHAGAATIKAMYFLLCRHLGWPAENPSLMSLPTLTQLPNEDWWRTLAFVAFPFGLSAWVGGAVSGLSVHRPFHISSNSLSELDQGFALFGGCAVFLFWFREALKSRTKEGVVTREE